MLLRCTDSAQHMSQLIRRVQARGRENSSFAESRVRKNFTESARWWAIVAALPPRLRGITVDVDAMQVGDLQSWCSPAVLFWWLWCTPTVLWLGRLSALLPLPHMSSTASTLLARDRWCAGTRPCAEVCGGCFAALSDAGPAPARAALPVGVSPANFGAKTPALACSFCNFHRRRQQQQQQQQRIVLLRHRLHIQAVTAPLLAAIPFPLNV